jgi:hypothetical protein
MVSLLLSHNTLPGLAIKTIEMDRAVYNINVFTRFERFKTGFQEEYVSRIFPEFFPLTHHII